MQRLTGGLGAPSCLGEAHQSEDGSFNEGGSFSAMPAQ